MLKSKNIGVFKKKLIYLIISIYILSFFVEHYFKLEFDFFRFSIVEIIFIILTILTLLFFKANFIRFLFKFDKNNIFEVLVYTILILKLIKYLLNFQNYYNLYELLIWIYMS